MKDGEYIQYKKKITSQGGKVGRSSSSEFGHNLVFEEMSSRAFWLTSGLTLLWHVSLCSDRQFMIFKGDLNIKRVN